MEHPQGAQPQGVLAPVGGDAGLHMVTNRNQAVRDTQPLAPYELMWGDAKDCRRFPGPWKTRLQPHNDFGVSGTQIRNECGFVFGPSSKVDDP